MKKVLFDGTATQSSSRAAFHGGGEYAKFMLRAALERGYDFDVILGSWLFTDESISKLVAKYQQVKVHQVENKQQLYDLIDGGNYDLFYSALPAAYSDYPCGTPLLGVVHGLRGAELPWDLYRYKYEAAWHKRLLGLCISHCHPVQDYLKRKHIAHSQKLLAVRNARFITVSNHTKYAMLAFYPDLKADDIKVYYSPFAVKEVGIEPQKGNYFLMVSGNRYEKNTYRAVKTFDRLFSCGRLEGKKVVITGCGNQPFWSELKCRERFDLKPYVSTEELEELYRRAFCFVYPSLNEGFGYPPLKAMAYGTPVIASSATSIPEVCDAAACYFSPTNMDDLAARLLLINDDADYRQSMAERGTKRVKELQEKQGHEILDELKMIFEDDINT